MMSKMIFTVEDEENIEELICCTLEAFDYSVVGFSNAEKMFDALPSMRPDLILLDIMLPGMDGMQALRRLKHSKYRDIPVIMLTAKESEPDKVAGLNEGADDYIAKPFGVLELGARVNAALRRVRHVAPEVQQILTYRDIVVDQKRRTVVVGERVVFLTRKEYEILVLLLGDQSRIVTREEFLNTVWGYDFLGESRTLDIHIKTLRKKLGDDADAPKYIKTVRGVGYALV